MFRHALSALTLLLIATTTLAADSPCATTTGLTGLPLVELTAAKQSDRFAVMISGDGGWRRIDTKVTDRLRAEGIPVVGFLAPDYFKTRRTPDESACALERVIRAYQTRWQRSKVILVGYSRGADVLPFMANRLPADLRANIETVALLGLEPSVEFKYDSPWTFARFHKEPQFPVKPEVEKLRGLRILCIYGEKEKDSLCHELDPTLATPVREPGGHHFGGHYDDVAAAILNAARP